LKISRYWPSARSLATPSASAITFRETGGVGRAERGHVRVVLLRDHEHVDWRLGGDVPEGDSGVRRRHDVRGDVPCHDLAEEAVRAVGARHGPQATGAVLVRLAQVVRPDPVDFARFFQNVTNLEMPG